jgi:hypothetical protein
MTPNLAVFAGVTKVPRAIGAHSAPMPEQTP